MSNVIQLFSNNVKPQFTLESAKEILPIIQRATKHADSEIKVLLAKMSEIDPRSSEGVAIELQVNELFVQWQTKMTKLGVEGKGMFMVDFDTGVDYLCWKFPETSLEHRHEYTEGMQHRTKICDDSCSEKVK